MYQTVASSTEYAVEPQGIPQEELETHERGKHLQSIGDALAHGAEKITKVIKHHKEKKIKKKDDHNKPTSTSQVEQSTEPQSDDKTLQDSKLNQHYNELFPQTQPLPVVDQQLPLNQPQTQQEPLYNILPDYPPGYSPYGQIPQTLPPAQAPLYQPTYQPTHLPTCAQHAPLIGNIGHNNDNSNYDMNNTNSQNLPLPLGQEQLIYNVYSHTNQPPAVYPPHYQHVASAAGYSPLCPQQQTSINTQLPPQPHQPQPNQPLKEDHSQDRKMEWLKEGNVEETEGTFTLLGSHEQTERGGRIVLEQPFPVDREIRVSADIFSTRTSGFCSTFTFLPRYDVPAAGQNFDEISFDIPCREDAEIEWIYSKNGKRVESGKDKELSLGIDYVYYEIRFLCGQFIKFVVNGREIKNATVNVPTSPLRLAFSLWRPDNDWAGRVKTPCSAKTVIKNISVHF